MRFTKGNPEGPGLADGVNLMKAFEQLYLIENAMELAGCTTVRELELLLRHAVERLPAELLSELRREDQAEATARVAAEQIAQYYGCCGSCVNFKPDGPRQKMGFCQKRPWRNKRGEILGPHARCSASRRRCAYHYERKDMCHGKT